MTMFNKCYNVFNVLKTSICLTTAAVRLVSSHEVWALCVHDTKISHSITNTHTHIPVYADWQSSALVVLVSAVKHTFTSLYNMTGHRLPAARWRTDLWLQDCRVTCSKWMLKKNNRDIVMFKYKFVFTSILTSRNKVRKRNAGVFYIL